MKQLLSNKRILFPTLGALVVVGVGVVWWVDGNAQASKYYPADLASRGYFDVESGKGVVTLGNKQTGTQAFESQITFAPDAKSLKSKVSQLR